MRRYALVLFVIAAAWMAGDHPISAAQQAGADPCPLKWRKDPEAAARARAAKKQRMRQNGVPERYLHLLDKMECVACIETAPDTLHITVLYHDDEHAPTLSTGERDLKVEFKWNAQSERQLREELRNGQIQSFYVWIHEKRCFCCPDFDQRAEDHQDWNDDTELNMDEAQAYDDPGDLGPLPDDLKPPPPGSQTAPPPIERFDDLPRPTRRVLQATCPPCEELARQWTNESNNLNFLWDRKVEQMRRVSVIANARTNRANEIRKLEYEQRFDSTRTYDNLQTIKDLKAVNEAQEADQDRAEREIERLDKEIRETEVRMEELMRKFLECEKACKKTTTGTTTGSTGPVLADTAAGPPSANAGGLQPAATTPGPDQRPAPSSAPGGPPARCPDCTAAAAEVARLNGLIGERTAELNRLRALEAGNSANIANLVRLRADAARETDGAQRVAELEGRIADLQAANADLRAQQFSAQQEITRLNEAVAAATRALDACNASCGAATTVSGTGTGTTGTGTATRTVVVNPLPPITLCKECEPLAAQLRAAHQELQRIAQRANDLQMQSDFEQFEDQRQEVARLQRELEECVRTKCANTTTADTSGNLNTTGGSGTSTTGTTPATIATAQAPSMCRDCDAAAAEVTRLNGLINERTAELKRLAALEAGNNANAANLAQLRADAARGAGGAPRVAELEGRIADLQAANAGLRAQQFAVQQEITGLNEAVAKATRELEACNSSCAGATNAPGTGTGTGGTGTPKRNVAVNPLPPMTVCKECEPAAAQLRTAHQELQRLAQRANDLQIESDFQAFEEQRAKLAQLEEALKECVKTKCGQTTTTTRTDEVKPTTTTASAPGPQTTGTAPGTPFVPRPPVTIDGFPNHSGDMYARTRDARAECPKCQAIVDELEQLNQQRRQAWAEYQQLQAQFEAMGNDLRADDEAFRAATKRGDAAAAAGLRVRLQETVGRRTEVSSAAQAKLTTVDRLNTEIDFMFARLNECNRSCEEPTTVESTACAGTACSSEWNACSMTNSCTPIERDCGVPGTCTSGGDPNLPTHNLLDPSAWNTAANAEVEQRIQIKMGEVFSDLVIPGVRRADIRSWFNPLGLLARRMVDNVERWRGSVGPRPLITPRDLREIERYSNAQAIGLPKGVHVLLTDRGGSTGRTLAMQVLNLTGQPVKLASMPFAIEPIKQQAQARVQQAFTRLTTAAPMSVDLAGYCLEFLKLPPSANQIFRLAPAAVQKKYEAMSKVLRSAYRVQHAGLLRPDSNPAAYTDAIKQWSLWAVEQNFNEARFTDAFLTHTKKNAEAAGQSWTRQADDMIRKVSPNRWRDILKVLQGAGVPVPR